MPSHNSFFGGLYSLKINYNNPILGMASYTETPYPPIIPDPNLLQIMKNWNIADTGLTLTTYVAFTLLSLRVMRRLAVREGSHNKRNSFLITNGTTFFICLAIGLRNSCYRLTGLVPNGLKKRQVYDPVKYQYSDIVLKNSFLSWFIQTPKRPTV